jgi:hypothetical protein
MKTVAQLLKHNFKKGSLSLYDLNGNEIYQEDSDGIWCKWEYDSNGNQIYREYSDGEKSEYDSNGNQIYYEDVKGYWIKREYDANGTRIYFEDSNGEIVDNRPKEYCVVQIDGKTYKLVELNK